MPSGEDAHGSDNRGHISAAKVIGLGQWQENLVSVRIPIGDEVGAESNRANGEWLTPTVKACR